MKKKIIFLFLLAGIAGWIIFRLISTDHAFRKIDSKTISISETDTLSLKKGDLLVRPNWAWLPGTSPIPNGRMFGHVAIVLNDVSGKPAAEVLSEAKVIEAVLFNQETRKFIFRKEDQVRETRASISFGPRFKRIRYRLRMPLTKDQSEKLIFFLKNQFGGSYSVLSTKNIWIRMMKDLKD